MKAVVSGHWSEVSSCGTMIGLLLIALCTQLSCSVPNLESPDCDQARDVVRELYSSHFGNNQAFASEDLEKRKMHLTARFLESLRGGPPIDPFTRTSDQPKAFRVGECRIVEPGRRVAFELVLFWKTDTRTEQRAINVEVENVGNKWLIDSVTN